MLDREVVVQAFRALLNRDPESDDVIRHFQGAKSYEALIRSLIGSAERQAATRPGPLWNYASCFDPYLIAKRHEKKNRFEVPGHRVNYLGVAVNVSRFFPNLKLTNIVEPMPLPNNWHTDLAELSAALRAVELSEPQFSMIELGCGWGCWMNITGVAARAMGKQPYLIGVEGDEGHVAFAHESLKTNGFFDDDYSIFRGIAAAKSGLAFFPKQEMAGAAWGLEPILNPTSMERNRLHKDVSYDELKIFSLEEISQGKERIDLLHIDIQGGEADLIRESLPFLQEKVAYIVVGTHSRVLDGEIISALSASSDWELEIERPTIHDIYNGSLRTRIDGVQGWRNRRLTGLS